VPWEHTRTENSFSDAVPPHEPAAIGDRLQESFQVNSKLVRRRVIVHGHVQGVWFRDSIRERARSRGITGWARNRPDGTLEAVLEGQPDAVAQIVSFCQTGPPRARVGRVEVQDQTPEGLTGFVMG
jgi:acylphosphatase